MNAYEANLVAAIKEHGWFCTSVLSGDDGSPAFSYSVGFMENLASPECIVFGLDSKLSHAMLWRVFRQIKNGRVFRDGDRWSDLIEGFDCVSRRVDASNIVRDYFNSAIWYWGDPAKQGRALEAYQLVWPSAVTGLFPWDEGASAAIVSCQPPLYLPRAA